MDPIRNSLLSFLALVVLVALTGQAFAGSSVTAGLCAGPGTHYITIQAAVNVVAVNGTVKVCPGTYPEQVTITQNLTLVGIGPTAATIVPPVGGLVQNAYDLAMFPVAPVAAQIFVQNAAVTISHLTVDGAGNGLDGCGGVNLLGIYYQNSSGTITDNAVRNQITPINVGCGYGFGIYAANNVGTPAVAISNNSVRNYGKNGILVSGSGSNVPGPVATVTGNTVVGLGATTLIAGNGIQLSLLATGKVVANYVTDNVYINPPGCTTCWGSSAILLYASPGVNVTSNSVETSQLGIVPITDPNYGSGDGTIIKSNHIGGTQNFDAIDLCSNNNTVQSNVIYGSSQDGIHADASCGGTGKNNLITGNTINEACAGVLLGTGTGNTIAGNTFMNVSNTTMAGDSCTPTLAPAADGMKMGGSLAKHSLLRAQR